MPSAAQRLGDLLGGRRRFGERDLAARRVVGGEHPARPAGPGGGDDVAVEEPLDVLGRDAAGPQDLGRATVQSTIVLSTPTGDGPPSSTRRAPDRAAAEVVDDVRGGGRADPAEAVGRRRGEPAAEAVEQLERHRVGGHAEPDVSAARR